MAKSTIEIKIYNTYSDPVNYLDIKQETDEKGIMVIKPSKKKMNEFFKANGFRIHPIPIFENQFGKIEMKTVVKGETVYGQIWESIEEKSIWTMISPMLNG
ncbi:hypothetical protein D3C71_1347400 [compost metagenome]